MNLTHSKKTVFLTLLCVCGLASAAPLPADPGDNEKAKDILIGMSGAFSGTSSELGQKLLAGMSLYFDHINDTSGVHGRRVTLQIYDDGYNPGPAISNTVKLIEEDRVLALLGYIGTPTVTRVLPILNLYQKDQVYLFFPFTGAEPQRRKPYDGFVYNLRASYHQETSGLVNNFLAVGRNRIAVFYQVDAYGRSGWDGVRQALIENDLDLVAEATYTRGTAYKHPFDEQVRILKDSGANAVISIGSYAAAAGFIRDARNSGWDVPVANLSFVNSDSLLDLLSRENAKTGVDYTGHLINSEVVPNYLDSDLQAVEQYRQLIQRRGQMDDNRKSMGFVSLEGFLNARLMVEILRRMGGAIDRGKFRSIMNGITNYDLGIGQKLTFGPGDNQGLDQVYFNTVVDGQWVTIEDWRKWKIHVGTF